MRKLVVAESVTLDGMIADQDGTTNFLYPYLDEEFAEHIAVGSSELDTLLVGRVTYEILANFWPTTKVSDNPAADFMNSVQKVVFSKTLKSAKWGPARVVSSGIAEEVQQLKQGSGKTLGVIGSARLVQFLADHDLVDEYTLGVVPVVLGGGTPLFRNLKKPLNLQLVESDKLRSGVQWSSYRPKKA